MKGLGVAAFLLVQAAHLAARGETSVQLAAPDHRGVSLLLNAGQFTAFGGGIALGTRAVGVRVIAGWIPLLVYSNPDLHFYSGFQVGPDLYARIFAPQPTVDIGAVVGYRYSNLVGHGFAAGGYAQLPLNRGIDINVSGGFLFFPDGNDHLIQQEGLPAGTQFSFPGATVNFGFSVGLAFFP